MYPNVRQIRVFLTTIFVILRPLRSISNDDEILFKNFEQIADFDPSHVYAMLCSMSAPKEALIAKLRYAD